MIIITISLSYKREMLSENKWSILIDYFGKITVESIYEDHIYSLSDVECYQSDTLWGMLPFFALNLCR